MTLNAAQCSFIFWACLALLGITYEGAKFVRKHLRWRSMRIRAPWDGAIAGRTATFYVQRWDRHDKWDAAVRGRIVSTPRVRR